MGRAVSQSRRDQLVESAPVVDSGQLEEAKRRVAELEEMLTSEPVNPLSFSQKEARISELEAICKDLRLEVKRLAGSNNIEVESLKRRHINRVSMLEDQLKAVQSTPDAEAVKKMSASDLREELLHAMEERENERKQYRLQIHDLETEIESLTSQVSHAESSKKRELETLKKSLTVAEKRLRSSGQEFELPLPEREREPSYDGPAKRRSRC
eukprot:TRINITY_DN3037_c0_g2_i1.p1 TRINITY_DN3037_c0_g2~~TRINITY_DN3037_c0_g2_i1.p1  ORF type:complete len:236 (-),score=44.61 TRINITY_DN3037_c0_g2_i1:435-1067(-)